MKNDSYRISQRRRCFFLSFLFSRNKRMQKEKRKWLGAEISKVLATSSFFFTQKTIDINFSFRSPAVWVNRIHREEFGPKRNENQRHSIESVQRTLLVATADAPPSIGWTGTLGACKSLNIPPASIPNSDSARPANSKEENRWKRKTVSWRTAFEIGVVQINILTDRSTEHIIHFFLIEKFIIEIVHQRLTKSIFKRNFLSSNDLLRLFPVSNLCNLFVIVFSRLLNR